MTLFKKHKYVFSFITLTILYSVWFYLKPRPLSPVNLEIGEVQKLDIREIHSSKDVQKDVDYLVYALQEGYVGQRAYPQEFEEMIASLQSLKADPEIKSKEIFMEKMSQILHKFPDGHLNIINQVASDKDDSLEEASSYPSAPYAFKHRIIKGKDVLFARISTFLITDLDEQEKFISEFKKQMRHSQAIVFDLRGNGGGVEELPLEMAALLWGETLRLRQIVQYYRMPIKSRADVHTPVSFALHKNFDVVVSSRWGRYLASESKKGLIESILTYNEYGFDSTRKKITRPDYEFSSYVDMDMNTLTYTDENYRAKGYKHPLILVTDKKCASACERFIEALEAHPQFKHIGEHTAGATQFDNVGFLELPVSRADIVIPTAFITYFDNRRPERVGYQPQYVIPPGKDPLKEIAHFL